MKTISFFLTEDIKVELQQKAKQNYMSFSALIKFILSKSDLNSIKIQKLSRVKDDAATVSISADLETVNSVKYLTSLHNISKTTLLTSVVLNFLDKRKTIDL